MSNRLKAYLALALVAAIWGIAGPVIKATLSYIPPFTFLFYRFAIVVLFTIPMYGYYLKRHPLAKQDLFPLSILGLLATTINLSLIFLGFERTTALDGTLLSSVTPIFIVALGVLFLREKITKVELAGLILVGIGSIVTVVQPILEDGFPSTSSGLPFALENSLGNTLILAAGIEWAMFVLLSKKNFSHYSPLLITLHSSIIAFITFLPLSLLEQSIFQTGKFDIFKDILNFVKSPALFGVLYMGILSYIVAYYLYEYGMSKIEISEGSLFSYLQPVFAAPVAIIFLNEKMSPVFIVGAIIITLGILLSEFLAHKELQP